MKQLLSNRIVWAGSALVLAILIVVIGVAVGMRGGILIAFSVGAIMTSALGIGLMALIFYSSRSGHDDAVSGTTDHSG